MEIKTPFEGNKNILKESGYIFEKIAYGKVKSIFTLKQLLFIGNEKNDNLNVNEYRKKFIEISKQNIDELFNAYDKNNILGELVQDIYILLKNELGKDFDSLLNTLIVSKEDGDGEDIYEDFEEDESIQEELKELKKGNEKKESKDPLEKFAEKFIIVDKDHYDCHIKGTYICNRKMYVEDEY